MSTLSSKLLDDNGKVIRWPKKKRQDRPKILNYLHSKFDGRKKYTEKEVNNIIKKWICFSDFVLIRRELYDRCYLDRTIDGKAYWRLNKEDAE